MDRDEFEGAQQGHMGGPSMAFGPEARRVANERPTVVEVGHHALQGTLAERRQQAASTVGIASGGAIQRTGDRPADRVGDAARLGGAAYTGGAMVSIRMLRNGWVVDDGRGMEMVATSAQEAAAIALDWMRQAERKRAGGEVPSPNLGGQIWGR